ncbi:hypothetical protein BJ166DRAFT_541900 [Pestalotiopsis sp. NC0098]|nr:hypothetical protein BJ166DRAFT_541900 [Pestalotiopsis sp. NC0098]
MLVLCAVAVYSHLATCGGRQHVCERQELEPHVMTLVLGTVRCDEHFQRGSIVKWSFLVSDIDPRIERVTAHICLEVPDMERNTSY